MGSDITKENGGVNFASKKDSLYKQALDYYLKAVKINRQMGDSSSVAVNLGNIGIIFENSKNYSMALSYYRSSLKIAEAIDDPLRIATQLGNIGNVYMAQLKYKEAEKSMMESIKISKKLGAIDYEMQTETLLTTLYEKMGKHKLALVHYKTSIILRDSIFNEENTKKTVRSEMNFEFEKKEATAKLEQEKKEAVSAAESRKQKVLIWSVSGILLLVFGFAIFAYRSYLQKQKTNIEITKQKYLIEEKQKEILDSIYYARRIQRSLLPTEKYIVRCLGKIAKK